MYFFHHFWEIIKTGLEGEGQLQISTSLLFQGYVYYSWRISTLEQEDIITDYTNNIQEKIMRV